MLCGWGVKAGWLIPYVDKCVGVRNKLSDHSLTHASLSTLEMHICTHYKHTHTTGLRPFFQDYPGEPVPEEIFFWTSVVQGKITEANTRTIRLGATLSGLISHPTPSSAHFYAECPTA